MSIKTEAEIKAKIQELTKMSYMIPKGVFKGEKETWLWYCRGGISALRWILGLEIGKPRKGIE